VTSPPYWAKRGYGVTGQYGHEPDPAGYVDTLVRVFREARRVLAADWTCWLNLGDSYPAGGASPTGLHAYLGPGLAGRQAPGMGAKNLLGSAPAPSRSSSRTAASSSPNSSTSTCPGPFRHSAGPRPASC
jgi:hypothetical protein